MARQWVRVPQLDQPWLADQESILKFNTQPSLEYKLRLSSRDKSVATAGGILRNATRCSFLVIENTGYGLTMRMPFLIFSIAKSPAALTLVGSR